MKIIWPEALEAPRTRRCEYCGAPPRSQAAHVIPRGQRGVNRLDVPINLVGLDITCHTRSHGTFGPTQDTLIRLVAKREGYSPEAVWEALQTLVRCPAWKDWSEDRKRTLLYLNGGETLCGWLCYVPWLVEHGLIVAGSFAPTLAARQICLYLREKGIRTCRR